MTEYYQLKMMSYLKIIFRLIIFLIIAGNITLPKKDFQFSSTGPELSYSFLNLDGHQSAEDNSSGKSFDPTETDIHQVLVCTETIIKLEKLTHSTDVPIMLSYYFLNFFIPPSFHA